MCIVGAPEPTSELLLPLLDWSCQSCSAHVCVIPTTNTSTTAACSDEQAQTYVYAYSQGHAESHACMHILIHARKKHTVISTAVLLRISLTRYKIAASFLNFCHALTHKKKCTDTPFNNLHQWFSIHLYELLTLKTKRCLHAKIGDTSDMDPSKLTTML